MIERSVEIGTAKRRIEGRGEHTDDGESLTVDCENAVNRLCVGAKDGQRRVVTENDYRRLGRRFRFCEETTVDQLGSKKGKVAGRHLRGLKCLGLGRSGNG